MGLLFNSIHDHLSLLIASLLRLYHLSKDEARGVAEYNLLNQDLLPMSRYNMTDGDEIHIEAEMGKQDFSVHFVTSMKVSNRDGPSKLSRYAIEV